MSNSLAILSRFRNFIVAFFLVVLAVGIFPSAAVADRGAPWDVTEPADYYVIVTSGDGVNIRSYPDESQSKVGFAPYETRLHVIGTTNNTDSGTWMQIDSPAGWVIASAVIEESQYVPPAPPSTESTPDPAETTTEQTPTTDQSNTAKAQGAEQSSQQSSTSKGLVIALVVIVAVICIISMLLLYLLFVKGKKTEPGSPAAPW